MHPHMCRQNGLPVALLAWGSGETARIITFSRSGVLRMVAASILQKEREQTNKQTNKQTTNQPMGLTARR